MGKTNIKLMFWYKNIGRYIYIALFALELIITFIQIINRKSNILIPIFLDVTFALVGVILESNLMKYAEQGTTYVETGKRVDKFNLEEYQIYSESYFVSETKDEYVVKLPSKTTLISYKKSGIILEENPNIDTPIIEITTTEKISKPADNEYSIFALIGDKIKTESQKIIVKNKTKDIGKA